jgi:hypothetical protein
VTRAEAVLPPPETVTGRTSAEIFAYVDALPPPRWPDPLVFGPPGAMQGSACSIFVRTCPCGTQQRRLPAAACWCCGKPVTRDQDHLPEGT